MEYGSNTYNNFLLSIPKKQAKSYEIDLGQNNGAYDEELLIRYGDNTLNHMKNKNRGGNLNMDDIMKMNEQLKPFQERKPAEEGQVSFSQICDGIEEKIEKIDKSAEFLEDFEKNLNKAIEVMTNDIFKFFDDTYNEFNPKLLEKYSYLKVKIKEQKDENANLLKQIDFLLQENKVGIDKPPESYEKNVDEEKSEEESTNESENEKSSQAKEKVKEENNDPNNEENIEENNEEGEHTNKEEENENEMNEEEKEKNEIAEDEINNKSKEDFSEKEQGEIQENLQENNEIDE